MNTKEMRLSAILFEEFVGLERAGGEVGDHLALLRAQYGEVTEVISLEGSVTARIGSTVVFDDGRLIRTVEITFPEGDVSGRHNVAAVAGHKPVEVKTGFVASINNVCFCG